MISAIISRFFILLFGTLYPAYASYKTVKTKNVKEYVKWMMYWIVFALFTTAETFTDVFLSWLPFYYEIKIVLVLWLLSPATKGSSILYRKFVHPTLSSKEQEIDEYISKAKEQGYKHFLDLGQRGVSALMQTAIKSGGGIVNQLRKSYSLSDLTESDIIGDDTQDGPEITDPRLLRVRHRNLAASSIYFQEIDVKAHERLAHVQSVDDISSGYSSSEGIPPKLQAREGLVRTGSLTRTRVTRVTRSTNLHKPSPSDDSDGENIIYINDKAQSIDKLEEKDSSEDDFVDSLDNPHDKCNNNLENLTACNSVKDEKGDDKIREIRGGRYNKKVAPVPPPPPPPQSSRVEDVGMIKATLVLKPGMVKPLPMDNSCKEIFVQSPKLRRRKLTSLNQALSSSLNKLDSSLNKFLNLPQKIKNTKSQRRGSNLKIIQISKSENNLSNCENGDKFSIKSLPESPSERRRLRIIRQFIDDDVD